MADEERQSQLGRTLVGLGAVGLVFSFVGQSFIGPEAAGFFLPAVIVLFIGRSINRRNRRRSMDEVKQASQPVDKPRSQQQQRPRPEPKPRPKPAVSTAPPDRAKVESDLAEALAAYRTEPAETEAGPVVPDVDVESLEFRPKTSAEMIEEARRKFNKEL